MSTTSDDLNRAEDAIITAFKIALETANEIQRLPDTNADRIRQLSNSYFEMVTKARNIIIAAHSEIRKNGEDGELNQEQPTPPAFNLEHALEALANNNININNGGCASGGGKI